MTKLSINLSSIRQSPTVALSDEVRKLNLQGKNIIELMPGDPDFSTPEKITRLTCEYLKKGYTHYASSRGVIELRENIAIRYNKDYGVNYDPEKEILICNGGIHAVYCSLAAILNKDDEVLIINPSWKQYSNIVSILGGKPVMVDTKYEEDFVPSISMLKESITDKTTAIILNYPNNPTGTIVDEDYLEKVVKFAKDNNLWIISDEVYEKIIFDGIHNESMCSIKGAKERTIIVNSFSKTYAMTGWRMGFILADEKVINLALKASQHTITSAQPFVQKAVADCINDSEVDEYVNNMIGQYQKRRDLVKQVFDYYNQDIINIKVPKGALYYFIDIRKLNKSSEEAAKELLKEKNVAYVPGNIFGSCGEGFLRMTIAAKPMDIENGFRRLMDWAREKL